MVFAWVIYFGIGSVVAVSMARAKGFKDEVQEQCFHAGLNIDSDKTLISILISGVLLWPLMILLYINNGFKWS